MRQHIVILSSLIIFHVANEVNSFEIGRLKRQVVPDSCKTLNGDPGICVPIKECNEMFELLVTNKYDLEIRRQVIKSHCGFVDKHPKTCCKITLPEGSSSTSKPSLTTSKVFISLPVDRISTENPLPSSETTSTTELVSSTSEISLLPDVPLTTSKVPWSSSEIPSTTSEVLLPSTNIPFPSELSSSETPITTPNLQFSSTDIPLTSELSSSETPITTPNLQFSSTDIPLTLELSSSETPITTPESQSSTNIPLTSELSSSEISITTSELPFSSTDTPSSSELTSSEIPITTTTSTSSLSETSQDLLPTAEKLVATDVGNPETPSAIPVRSSDNGEAFKHFPRECGRSVVDTNRRISGIAPLNAWPWLALLGYSVPGKADVKFYCVGALITNRHILTVAHCIRNTGSSTLKLVRLGELEINSAKDGANPIDIEIDSTIPHKAYDNFKHVNDIAIIKLKDAVTFTDSIRPICLPFSDDMRSKNYTGTTNYIAGWGADEINSQQSRQLLETRVPVISTEECKESPAFKDRTYIKLDERTVCAGGGKSDACRGDSGTPLMFKEGDQIHSIGLVSFGSSGCGVVGSYTVYTRVTQFLDWIAENTL